MIRYQRKTLWVFTSPLVKGACITVWDGIVPPVEGQKLDKRNIRFVDGEKVLEVWFSQNITVEWITNYAKENKGRIFNEKAV